MRGVGAERQVVMTHRPDQRSVFEDWLRAVAYRPGVTFSISGEAFEIKVHTVDSRSARDDLREIDVTHRTLLPEIDHRLPEAQRRAAFLDFVRDCVLAMERHESQEWFRVNGRMVVDPHAIDLPRLT
jgi:hypothetical protein